jgi:UDPglucose 6-dehydrogenase/GDP-mannose 6-dehydrogenase
MTRVSVIGAGYVGLVTGLCLADLGIDVVCVDRDTKRIEDIGNGVLPIHEPGLAAILDRTLGGKFEATTDLAQAVADTDVTFIAVGTPLADNGIDITFVRDAAAEIGAALVQKSDYHVVAIKSTVVPGTTDRILIPELEAASGKRAGASFGVAVNPEFLTEGTAVDEFMHPDRIVIGGLDERSKATLVALHQVFESVDIQLTNPRTAEMIKYVSNALLATMISFSNEIANLGAAIGGIDTVEVMRGVHTSRYFTSRGSNGKPVTAAIASFLEAGCGFGGSCLPKDAAALAALSAKIGSPTPVLEAVIAVNRRQPAQLVELVVSELGNLTGRRIAVLGLSFKPDTGDVRESPAFPVIEGLQRHGAEVVVHDPVVVPDDLPDRIRSSVEFQGELETAVESVEAVVLVTKWSQYADLPRILRDRSPQPLLADGRRMLEKDSVTRYVGIGL